MAGPVEVIALRRGYYGSLREAGEVFVVSSASHVGSWMTLVVRPAESASQATKPIQPPRKTAR